MQRFARIISAGTLVLALLAGGSATMVAHAQDMTIQGNGYVGTVGGGSSSSSSGGSSSSSGSSSSGSSSSAAGSSSSEGPSPSSSSPGGSQGGGDGQNGGQENGGRPGGTTGGQSTSRRPASSSSSSSLSTSLIQPEETSTPEPQTPGETERDFDDDIPLAGRTPNGWSLINLIFAAIALLAGLVLLLRATRRKAGKRTFALGTVGILPMLLFFLLESFGGQMQLVSKWTPLLVCTTFAYLAAAILVGLKSHKTGNS